MTSKFKIECVDALALTFALERLSKHNYGNGVESVTLDEASQRHGHEDAETLEFVSSRYAMDGAGMHVGYESFTATFQLYPLQRPYMGATPYSGCFIVPDWMEVAWEPAQETHEYTAEDARQFLDEYIEDWADEIGADATDEDSQRHEVPQGHGNGDEQLLDLAFDSGMAEYDYTPPDEDFAYQELRYHLDRALEDLPEGDFIMDERGRRWELKFADGEVARTFWIEVIDDAGKRLTK